jgi:hypothetical protein
MTRSDIPNVNCKVGGSLLSRGRSLVLIFIVERASGGRRDRNMRAVFARGENGLKAVVTDVRNLVIILMSLDCGIVSFLYFKSSDRSGNVVFREG